MYGLINRSIQCFVEDLYGPSIWDRVARDAQLEHRDFEAMLEYPDDLTDTVLEIVARCLRRDIETVLEDLGTYLVTHPNREAIRRLLRFSGHNYDEFLQSLDDLQDRVKLAVPDLEMPELELREYALRQFALQCSWRKKGFGSVFVGILRAMADDYGALVVLDYACQRTDAGFLETVNIELLERAFADGREFHLADRARA